MFKGRFPFKNDNNWPKGGFLRYLGKIALYCLIAVLLSGSFHTLKDDQYAVVTTLGTPHTEEGRGLKFKLPLIQDVTKVTRAIQGFPLGYRATSDEYYEAESLMITVDYNFVNMDFYVEYRITQRDENRHIFH